jgi:hypothetical protein
MRRTSSSPTSTCWRSAPALSRLVLRAVFVFPNVVQGHRETGRERCIHRSSVCPAVCRYMRVVDFARGMFLMHRSNPNNPHSTRSPDPSLAADRFNLSPAPLPRILPTAVPREGAQERGSWLKLRALDGQLRMLTLARGYLGAARRSEATFLPSLTEGVRACIDFAVLRQDHATVDAILLSTVSHMVYQDVYTPATLSEAVRVVALPLLTQLFMLWRQRREGGRGCLHAALAGASSLTHLHLALTLLVKISLVAHKLDAHTFPTPRADCSAADLRALPGSESVSSPLPALLEPLWTECLHMLHFRADLVRAHVAALQAKLLPQDCADPASVAPDSRSSDEVGVAAVKLLSAVDAHVADWLRPRVGRLERHVAARPPRVHAQLSPRGLAHARHTLLGCLWPFLPDPDISHLQPGCPRALSDGADRSSEPFAFDSPPPLGPPLARLPASPITPCEPAPLPTRARAGQISEGSKRGLACAACGVLLAGHAAWFETAEIAASSLASPYAGSPAACATPRWHSA